MKSRRPTLEELERASGSGSSPRFLGIVLFEEGADGVPWLGDVAVDAAIDDRFLERAIITPGDAVGLGPFNEGVGRLDASERYLVSEVIRQIRGR